MDIVGSVVLYKNDIKVLKEAINSFLNTQLKVQLILIDNSPNDYLKNLETLDTRIKYYFMGSNLGFGKAHNVAIKKSTALKSKYHLVLNPDIYYGQGELEKMYSFLENNKEFGHMMPKILYPDNTVQYLCKQNPTFFDLVIRRFLPRKLKLIFKNKMLSYENRSRDYNDVMFDIPYLSGCFMLFRTSVLEEIGGFDEKIFMYIEDADITLPP